MGLLNSESNDIIYKLGEEKLIESLMCSKILVSNSISSLSENLVNSFDLDVAKIKNILYLLDFDICKGAKNNFDKKTMLNIDERGFFISLLKNGGVIIDSDIYGNILKTEYLIEKTIKSLLEKKLIICLKKYKGWGSIYIINLKLFNEVLNE